MCSYCVLVYVDVCGVALCCVVCSFAFAFVLVCVAFVWEYVCVFSCRVRFCVCGFLLSAAIDAQALRLRTLGDMFSLCRNLCTTCGVLSEVHYLRRAVCLWVQSHFFGGICFS